MRPIIKWPGGKSREIHQIRPLIPTYKRYVEPFFGGGALFFHLMPGCAAINDISAQLMEYYGLIKAQDWQLHELLVCYDRSFRQLIHACETESRTLLDLFFRLKNGVIDQAGLDQTLEELVPHLSGQIGADFAEMLLLDRGEFEQLLRKMARDKYIRTVANDIKRAFSVEDLCENLFTGFASGYYMYFRKVYNDISLGRIAGRSIPYRAANFYFIREYCYGSMFRYNARGEFNIPYGGMSYNRKDMESKIETMFNREIERLFANTEIHCTDFEEFTEKIDLTQDDFMFLDPPYDTDFSDYEGRDFTHSDQARLADTLRKTSARFILVIKNTDFIHGLYEKDFNILSFDKQYTYNVRSRNDREAEHLIITNLPV